MVVILPARRVICSSATSVGGGDNAGRHCERGHLHVLGRGAERIERRWVAGRERVDRTQFMRDFATRLRETGEFVDRRLQAM